MAGDERRAEGGRDHVCYVENGRCQYPGCFRSPQAEDHEAGIEAAWRAFADQQSENVPVPESMRAAIAAYLARVSPSRDGTVAVEAAEALWRAANRVVVEGDGPESEYLIALGAAVVAYRNSWQQDEGHEARGVCASCGGDWIHCDCPARDGTVAVEDVVPREAFDLMVEYARAAGARAPANRRAMRELWDKAHALAKFARSATGEQTDHGGA